MIVSNINKNIKNIKRVKNKKKLLIVFRKYLKSIMLIVALPVMFRAKTQLGPIKRVWANFTKFQSKMKNIQSPVN